MPYRNVSSHCHFKCQHQTKYKTLRPLIRPPFFQTADYVKKTLHPPHFPSFPGWIQTRLVHDNKKWYYENSVGHFI